jgi:hypothetical protein
MQKGDTFVGLEGKRSTLTTGTKRNWPAQLLRTFELHTPGAAIVGTSKVVLGDGQEVERELFIKPPDC